MVTGFGVVDATDRRKLRIVDLGAIKPRAKDPLESRLLCIFRGVSEIIVKHSPQRVAVEGIYHAKNARSALTLGHARGVVLLAAAHAGLPLSAFSPSTVKAQVSGYGLASKQQVSWMVSRLLSLPADVAPGDAADALALAICGAELPTEQHGGK